MDGGGGGGGGWQCIVFILIHWLPPYKLHCLFKPRTASVEKKSLLRVWLDSPGILHAKWIFPPHVECVASQNSQLNSQKNKVTQCFYNRDCTSTSYQWYEVEVYFQIQQWREQFKPLIIRTPYTYFYMPTRRLKIYKTFSYLIKDLITQRLAKFAVLQEEEPAESHKVLVHSQVHQEVVQDALVDQPYSMGGVGNGEGGKCENYLMLSFIIYHLKPIAFFFSFFFFFLGGGSWEW